MPQVTITYKKPETLKILKNLAKELDFQVSAGEAKNADADDNLTPGDKSLSLEELHDVFTGKDFDPYGTDERLKRILVPGDPSIDDTELKEIFSGRNIDAKQLRKDAWSRKKY